jgi:hypothetical protein
MFTPTDFKNVEISFKLQVIINDKMDIPIMRPFKSISSLSKKNEFNKILNTYVNTFNEDWKQTLDRDFNDVMSHYMSQDGFRAENETCLHTNSTPMLIE